MVRRNRAVITVLATLAIWRAAGAQNRATTAIQPSQTAPADVRFLSENTVLDLEQGDTFGLKLVLTNPFLTPGPENDQYNIIFQVIFCTCSKIDNPGLVGPSELNEVISRGSLNEDHKTVTFRFQTSRFQDLGQYHIIRAKAYFFPMDSHSANLDPIDLPQGNYRFTIRKNTTYTPYQPPTAVQGHLEWDLTKAELLRLRIKSLEKSMNQLNNDLKNIQNDSAFHVRAVLQKSLSDESKLSKETEDKYLELTPDPEARKAVIVSFADVQSRYEELEKQNQTTAKLHHPELVLAGYYDVSAALKLFQKRLEAAMDVNIEIFSAMADNGDYIPTVEVRTEPEQKASVSCKTKLGPEIKPNNLTNTIFERFPYAQFHCVANKGLLKGELDYDSSADTHHLIEIHIQ